MRFHLHPDRAPHVRAADADREQVADQLRAHCATGRLTPDELGDRLEGVYQARTYGELAPLTADLPRSAEPVPARAPRRRRRVAPTVAALTLLVLAALVLHQAPVLIIPLFAIFIGILVGVFSLAFAAAPIVAVVGGTVWLLRRLVPGLTGPAPRLH